MTRARSRSLLTGFVLLAVLTGCGTSPSALPSAPTASPAPIGTPSVAPSASPIGPASPSPLVSPSAAVAVDPSLFALLPGSGNGLQFTFDPDTSASVAADPGLAPDAVGLAIGLYQVAASGSPSPDLAVVSVVRLRDPAADEEWFRSWRDSYDASACAQAGGLTRHAQAEIAGRTVFIGSCAGGAFTYHVRVAQGAIVVSITSVGESRLGQTILERIGP